METICKEYLAREDNNPQKAYKLFIKEHLELRRTLPVDIVKGLKDFLVVANK